MGLTITFLGHAGFLLSDGTHAVAIDPWLTDNPVATMSADEVNCNAICVTHGHFDHLADAEGIAKRTGATVHAAFEICNALEEQGVENLSPGNPGGKIDADWGWVAFTQAFHSSSYEGRYMGMPCGVVVHLGGKTVYHAGDTGLFSDMALIGEIYKPDVAILPIGDRFTMGPELATRAAEMIKAPAAIPCHYDTFDMIEQDPGKFSPSGVQVQVMKPGESWECA